MNNALYSSKTCEWSTPQELFDVLDAEFCFELDVCATSENAKCKRYYTIVEDGLSKPWDADACWCNPPYGRAISRWVQKAAQTADNDGNTVVMLLPARTDTRWFHKYIYNRGVEVRFLKGRIKFGNATNSAPFPSMIVVFKGNKNAMEDNA